MATHLTKRNTIYLVPAYRSTHLRRILVRKSNPNLIKLLDITTNLQERKEIGEHVK